MTPQTDTIPVDDRDATIAALRAENERLRREYDEEVSELNAGVDAYNAGLSLEDEPHDTKYDVWDMGWVWGKHIAETYAPKAGPG